MLQSATQRESRRKYIELQHQTLVVTLQFEKQCEALLDRPAVTEMVHEAHLYRGLGPVVTKGRASSDRGLTAGGRVLGPVVTGG